MLDKGYEWPYHIHILPDKFIDKLPNFLVQTIKSAQKRESKKITYKIEERSVMSIEDMREIVEPRETESLNEF